MQKPKLISGRWKRFFSVPCCIVDNYIKLADAAALKLLLYMLSSEYDSFDYGEASSALGVPVDTLKDAMLFWKQLGVVSEDDLDKGKACGEASTLNSDAAPKVQENTGKDQLSLPPASQGKVLRRSGYTPKEISELIEQDEDTRIMFKEAEKILGRLLKHADNELLINLKDYFGFSVPSIILILEYCRDMGKTSARYAETVAKDFYDNGIVDFLQIDEEIKQRKVYNEFENRVKRDFGIETKLTARQSKYISSWRNMGFDVEMISSAREKCVDSTNKLSFEYINKILLSWSEKNIFTPDAAQSDTKSKKGSSFSAETSFNIDEFDRFTLGIGENNKGENL